jgi:hypothetical protein
MPVELTARTKQQAILRSGEIEKLQKERKKSKGVVKKVKDRKRSNQAANEAARAALGIKRSNRSGR